jgi:hypothetical protein
MNSGAAAGPALRGRGLEVERVVAVFAVVLGQVGVSRVQTCS